jgi:hypothetical protein
MMTTKTGVELVDPVREERAGKVREVGSQAIWSLSSCKPGIFEIELMLQISVSILVKLNCSLFGSLWTLNNSHSTILDSSLIVCCCRLVYFVQAGIHSKV